ncbi:MAG TPA: hypothetical protein VJC08_04335 [bacterium]|nr:hypothetical protein [bacterium]
MKTVKISAIAILVSFLCAGVVRAEDTKRRFFWQARKEAKQEFKNQKREEKHAFKQSLKGKSSEEKKAAAFQHHQEMRARRKDFLEKRHAAAGTALKTKLDQNTKLTEEQKKRILDQHEKQYRGNAAFYANQAEDNQAFLTKTANDSALTQNQKQQAIRKYFEEQRLANKTHWQGQKQNREEFRSGLKQAAQTGQTAG